MFNRYALVVGGAQHHHTHVEMVDPSIEKGARFLDEVQREAEKRILSAAALEVPSIEAKLMHYEVQSDLASGNILHQFVARINGRPVKATLSHSDMALRGTDAVLTWLVTEIAKEVTRQLALTAVRTMFPRGDRKVEE